MDSCVQEATDEKRSAPDRLTDGEKHCLRRWLQHQTAKEIAIDLGVSWHAVEKRLKMARAKLGVSTSLEAARLLASYEEYQQSGPKSSDLDVTTQSDNKQRHQSFAIGVVVMSFVIAIAAITLTASSGQPTSPSQVAPVLPKPGEILIFGPVSFEEIDSNGSGFLEGEEAPKPVLVGGNAEVQRNENGAIEFRGDYIKIADDEPLRSRFYQEADSDRDGRVSPGEYERWVTPQNANS